MGNQPQAIYWQVEVSSLTNVSHLDPESASSELEGVIFTTVVYSVSVSISGEVPEETSDSEFDVDGL